MATSTSQILPDIESLHEAACAQGLDTYIDPATGYTVFTELSHRKRGKCCGSGCRHCPYEHIAVPAKYRGSITKPPILCRHGEATIGGSGEAAAGAGAGAGRSNAGTGSATAITTTSAGASTLQREEAEASAAVSEEIGVTAADGARR
jgi:hypothetical protein